MNKNKEVYQFKLDLIQADKRYINGNYLKIGWQAYYRISNSSLYNDLALYLIYQDFDPQGKKIHILNFQL